LVCSFGEAMAGYLSAVNTAVSSANIAVVDSVEVGRSAVYIRYNSGPRHCPEYIGLECGEYCVHCIQHSRESVCQADNI
jgi:uncharacterized protein YdbL (DUF1318 family)